MRLTVGVAQETVPDHDGAGSGTVTVPLVFSGISHTDVAMSDLTQFEGEVQSATGIFGTAKIAEIVLHVVTQLKKL